MNSPGHLEHAAASTTTPSDPSSADTPRSVVAALRIGGSVSLIAIAVISFDVLTDLGRQAGLHRLAELFPLAVDAFAASTLYAAYRLPGGHPARALAKRTARSALALTVCCNVLDHLLTLAGFLVPPIVRDLVLVAVASLPQLVADRELHLLIAVTAHRSGNVSPEPAPDAPAALDDQKPAATDKGATLTARDEAWLKVAGPVYEQLRQRDGRRPTEKAFHEALTQALAAQNGRIDGLDGQQERLELLGDSVSLSTAKRVRALVEAHRPFDAMPAGDHGHDHHRDEAT